MIEAAKLLAWAPTYIRILVHNCTFIKISEALSDH